MNLKFGCVVEQDSDGDWIICPPADVKIFSVPGEAVLLRSTSEADAIKEAKEYLSAISDEETKSK